MHYLTRIVMDQSKADAKRALFAPNLLHGAITDALPLATKRPLWRIDKLHNQYVLLILSDTPPNTSKIEEQFGTGQGKTIQYSKLLEQIDAGQKWRFRLVANPTYKGTHRKSGKYIDIAHTTRDHQLEWLNKKADTFGFAICNETMEIYGQEWKTFRKRTGGDQIRLLSVDYEGILVVTDKDKFCNALLCGIGREKAYGMGLLTVIPA